MRVGRWVRRTALEVLLRFCPPGPEPRKVSRRHWARRASSVRRRGDGSWASTGSTSGVSRSVTEKRELNLHTAVGAVVQPGRCADEGLVKLSHVSDRGIGTRTQVGG